MKTETKTGRWKYAAIVLIVTLLVGLFWGYVKNGPKGEIFRRSHKQLLPVQAAVSLYLCTLLY